MAAYLYAFDINNSCFDTVSAAAWPWLAFGFVSLLVAFRALEVMSGLQSSGVAPDCYDYSVIINAHLKRNDEAGALYYWQNMKESGVQPQLHDFTNFMHYYSSKGNVEAVKVSNCTSTSDLCETNLSQCWALEQDILFMLVCTLH